MTLIDRIRAAEPDWLATKRKAIIPPAVAAVVDGLVRLGVHLSTAETTALGLLVAAVVTWAIPNRRARRRRPAPEITISP